MNQRKKKVQTWWALKLVNGKYETDINGHPWLFTVKSKKEHREWAGGGIKWEKINLVKTT